MVPFIYHSEPRRSFVLFLIATSLNFDLNKPLRMLVITKNEL